MLAPLAFALALLPPPSPPPPPPRVIAIRAAAMLDVAAGRLVRDPVVIVEGERIRAAAPGLAIPAGAEVIDLRPATLLPGLIDAHTHVTTTYRFLLMGGPMHEAVTAHLHARKTLEAGITSVRDLWSKDFIDVALRDYRRRARPLRHEGRHRVLTKISHRDTETQRTESRKTTRAEKRQRDTENTENSTEDTEKKRHR